MTLSQQFPDARLRNPRIVVDTLIYIANATVRDGETGGFPGG